ncbi:MAG: mechanosensitive ion channel family protein [Acidimicrobiia bacterium]|nr:mechanosensitive ion channel family protein [Acidimicrobiia bacterium]
MSTAVLIAARGAEWLAQSPDPKVDACGEPGQQSNVCSWVFDVTNNKAAAEVAEALRRPVGVVGILFGAFLLNLVVRWMIRRFVRHLERESTQATIRKLRKGSGIALLDTTGSQPDVRCAQRSRAIGSVMRGVSSFLIWSFAIFWSLTVLGVNLAPLIAGAGIAGVALGFGAQTMVKDFLAGVFIIIEDQIGVGDIVDLGPATGTVEDVSLRVTRIRDVEGVVWFVPNGEIQRVGNLSQQWSRALLDIDVAYDTDIDAASALIKAVAQDLADDEEWSARILEPPEVWGVERFGPDAISIRLVIKTRPLEQFAVQRELRRRLKDAFDATGIEIPFPQRTVWNRYEGSPPENSATPPDSEESSE